MGTPAMWDSITFPPNAENSSELNKGEPNNPRANLVGSDTKKKIKWVSLHLKELF